VVPQPRGGHPATWPQALSLSSPKLSLLCWAVTWPGLFLVAGANSHFERASRESGFIVLGEVHLSPCGEPDSIEKVKHLEKKNPFLPTPPRPPPLLSAPHWGTSSLPSSCRHCESQGWPLCQAPVFSVAALMWP
jgi:hypothetical protein